MAHQVLLEKEKVPKKEHRTTKGKVVTVVRRKRKVQITSDEGPKQGKLYGKSIRSNLMGEMAE